MSVFCLSHGGSLPKVLLVSEYSLFLWSCSANLHYPTLWKQACSIHAGRNCCSLSLDQVQGNKLTVYHCSQGLKNLSVSCIPSPVLFQLPTRPLRHIRTQIMRAGEEGGFSTFLLADEAAKRLYLSLPLISACQDSLNVIGFCGQSCCILHRRKGVHSFLASVEDLHAQ